MKRTGSCRISRSARNMGLPEGQSVAGRLARSVIGYMLLGARMAEGSGVVVVAGVATRQDTQILWRVILRRVAGEGRSSKNDIMCIIGVR